MAKKIAGKIKVQAPGGQATPAPPIGPALGAHGVNIGQFISQFNERTKDLNGTPVPIEITVFADNSYEFIVKSPPAAVLLKEAAGLAKGSGEPNREKVGTVSMNQCREIAERKLADLSARDVNAGAKIIAGTARSMGIIVEGE